MRSTLFFLLLLAIGSVSAQKNYNNSWGGWSNKVKGNGEVTTDSRDLKNFTGISACCNLRVELRQGGYDVRVEAESNLQEYIRTEVSGGRLEIGFARNTNIQAQRDIVVYVTLPELDYLSASSSSEIVTKTAFTGEDLEIGVSSAASIKAEFSGREVRADASSGARIELAGRADRIRAEASSGAGVRAGEFSTKIARASASSGGGVTVNASEEVEGEASSGGSVRYRGKPSGVDANSSSGGSVKPDTNHSH
ncbi:head GIN domain-containing protein [Neolewinella lacunae]|uniref:DUF2807 domain-containing protein n=1 Tax=Neolewinella lacunae TaxID=1517758 RepID=A0A923T9K5_9BACT|nr:head GIN domain-containing protein [Neolewinella lacunae]MBC6995619.1 DUF2807 domain-containing protein [Neolewinella lacunae]MDN3635655.1 head GIN domain-containing protein [Neolewinella lacunae]